MRRRDNSGLRRGALHHWLPAVAWMLLIFFLSSRSQLPKPAHHLLDRLVQGCAHLFLYGVLQSLVWHAMRETWPGRRAALWSALFCLAYALSDEFHQAFVPGRHGTIADVGIDIVGVLLALVLIRFRQGRTRPDSRRTDNS